MLRPDVVEDVGLQTEWKGCLDVRPKPFTSMTVPWFGIGSNMSSSMAPMNCPPINSWLLIPYINNVLGNFIRSTYNIWQSENALGLLVLPQPGLVCPWLGSGAWADNMALARELGHLLWPQAG